MSQIKQKILKLISSTDISGRWRKTMERYSRDPDHYAKLHYHSRFHVRSVLNLFEVFRKMTGKGYSKAALRNAELAIVFHDMGHTGLPDTVVTDGRNNIARASEEFTQWANENNVSKDDRKEVYNLIAATGWPRGIDDFVYEGKGEYAELVLMIQDADMLWGMMPGNAEECMLGMWAERRNFGLEEGEIKILDTLVNQIKFIKNYEPVSAVGRIFKNAMFEDASNAWALIALQYQRQIEAADMVKEMSDSQVLALAAAMRPVVRNKMVGEAEQASAPPTESQEDDTPVKAQE